MTVPSLIVGLDGPGKAFHQILTVLSPHIVAVAAVGAVLLAVILARVLWRRALRRRWSAGARVLEVLPPAGMDYLTALAGGRRLWRDLMGLARPPLRRVVAGQPHLAVEYWLRASELSLRVWVPGPVPPGRVEAALRAAWPGALILPIPETDQPRLPTTGTVTGGIVRPGRGEHLPLHVPDQKTDSDPLRALESLATALEPGEVAVVQVLARPAVGRRVRRYRDTVHRVHTGRAARSSVLTSLLMSVVRELLDILTGSHAHQHTTASQGRGRPIDPLLAEELRAVRDKAAHPQWEIALRYAAATTATGPQARARVRGLADALFAMFSVLAGPNFLARHRLHRPAAALARRQLRRGALLSVPELAVIAHLPTRTAALSGGRARPVPAPRAVTGQPSNRSTASGPNAAPPARPRP